MSLHKSELSTKDAEKGTSDDVRSISDVGHLGVKTIQATHKVYGKYSKWFLFIRCDITSYLSHSYLPFNVHPIVWVLRPTSIHWMERLLTVTLLSRRRASVTTVSLAPFRLRSRLLVRSFSIHTTYIFPALNKFQLHVESPLLPRSPTLDPVERPMLLSVSKIVPYTLHKLNDTFFLVIFYVIGYIVIASSNNVQTLAGGIIIYAMYVLYIYTPRPILRIAM